jgi:hypothetical protein
MTDHVEEGQHIDSVVAEASLVYIFSMVAVSYVV